MVVSSTSQQQQQQDIVSPASMMKPTIRSPRKGGLVSQRVQMYEAPLNNARKGYCHRPQDSFHTQTTTTNQTTNQTDNVIVESRDDPPTDETFQNYQPQTAHGSRDIHYPRGGSTPSPTNHNNNNNTHKIPKNYAGCALIESGVQSYNQGEYEKALKAFSVALKMQRSVVGTGNTSSTNKDDICVALTLGNLGSVYLQQGKLDEAQKVLEESLEIKRKLAPTIPVSDILNNLGNCANIRGEQEASLIFYEEALEDTRLKKGRRADEINALFNIGRLEIQRQHYAKSMIALNEACKLAREHYGTNHVCVAQTLDLMGFVQLSTSKLDAAMVSFTGALAIYRRLHGPLHQEVANALFNVGMVREAKGDLNDALEAYTTARDLYGRLGTDHNDPGYKTVQKSISNVEDFISLNPTTKTTTTNQAKKYQA